MTSHFTLCRWTFDLVTDHGVAWAGATGEVTEHGLKAPFSSSFLQGHGERSALRYHAPANDGRTISWPADSLATLFTVDIRPTSFEKVLYSGPEGEVRWQCITPSGPGTLRRDALTLTGGACVELLTSTVAPWDLPNDHFVRGRFISARNAFVWIAWSGSASARVVLHNEREVEAAMISEKGIETGDDVAVRMLDRVTLREEQLGDTLRPLGLLRAMMPRRVAEAVDSKWVGRAIVTECGIPVDQGWVIQERITLPARERLPRDG